MRLIRIVLAVLLMPIAALGWAEQCHESSIVSPSPFMGSHGEEFKLSDGSRWKVVFEDEYLYAYAPRVTVCPDSGKMTIQGKTLKIQAIKPPPEREYEKPFLIVPQERYGH